MFDVDDYLTRLGFTGDRQPTVDTLRRLHLAHLQRMPFDNVLNGERGLGIWDGVDIDFDLTYKDVVVGGRGGVCYELNGLFRELLSRLGFETSILSAGVRDAAGEFGPDREHIFSGVRIGDQTWLADVGYSGPSYIEPLVVVPGLVQEQHGTEFRVMEDGDYLVVERRPQGGEFLAVYRLRPQPRTHEEWSVRHPDLEAYAQELTENETLIRGRGLENGQVTLTGRRLLTVRDGREEVRVLIKADDLEAALDDILLRR